MTASAPLSIYLSVGFCPQHYQAVCMFNVKHKLYLLLDCPRNNEFFLLLGASIDQVDHFFFANFKVEQMYGNLRKGSNCIPRMQKLPSPFNGFINGTMAIGDLIRGCGNGQLRLPLRPPGTARLIRRPGERPGASCPLYIANCKLAIIAPLPRLNVNSPLDHLWRVVEVLSCCLMAG